MAKPYLDPGKRGAIGRHGGKNISLPNVPAWLEPIPANERYVMTAPARKMPIVRSNTDLEDLAEAEADRSSFHALLSTPRRPA